MAAWAAGLGMALVGLGAAHSAVTATPVQAREPHGERASDPAAEPPERAAPWSAERTRATLRRYCLACHNARLRTAGLALEALDPGRVGDRPDVWERVVDKLRTGAMPPAGRPRPDRPTYAAVAASRSSLRIARNTFLMEVRNRDRADWLRRRRISFWRPRFLACAELATALSFSCQTRVRSAIIARPDRRNQPGGPAVGER